MFKNCSHGAADHRFAECALFAPRNAKRRLYTVSCVAQGILEGQHNIRCGVCSISFLRRDHTSVWYGLVILRIISRDDYRRNRMAHRGRSFCVSAVVCRLTNREWMYPLPFAPFLTLSNGEPWLLPIVFGAIVRFTISLGSPSVSCLLYDCLPCHMVVYIIQHFVSYFLYKMSTTRNLPQFYSKTQ